MIEYDEEQQLHDVGDRIRTAFPDRAPDEVERIVGEILGDYADAHVRDFVPLLVERRVRAALEATDSSRAAGPTQTVSANVVRTADGSTESGHGPSFRHRIGHLVGEPVAVICACDRTPCRHEGMFGKIAGQIGDDLYTVEVTQATRQADLGERLIFGGEELRARH